MKEILRMIVFAIILLTNTLVYADQSHIKHDRTKNTGAEICTGEIKVKVSGLVCDFCARALEKVFAKQDSVDSIKVDLTAGLVGVQIKDDKVLKEETLRKLITDSGYAIHNIDSGC